MKTGMEEENLDTMGNIAFTNYDCILSILSSLGITLGSSDDPYETGLFHSPHTQRTSIRFNNRDIN